MDGGVGAGGSSVREILELVALVARLNRGDVADDLLGEFSLAGRVVSIGNVELDIPSIVCDGQSNGTLVQRELGSVRHSSAATTRSSVVLRGIPRAIGRPEESDRAHDSALSTSTMDFGTRDQLPESAASEKKSSLGEHVEGCLWEMIHGEGLARKGR